MSMSKRLPMIPRALVASTTCTRRWPPAEGRLDAGDAFDQTMNKELPQEKLSGQIDTLSALAQGKMDDDMRLRATWGVLVRYATLYDTVKATGSDANKKKVDDALNTLNKALK